MVTKLLIVIMLSLFLFGFAHCAMGSTAIYYDQFCDGKVDSEGSPEVGMTAGFLGAGTTFGKWKVGVEYGKGEFGNPKTNKVSLLSLKAGYRVLDRRATKLDVAFSTLDMDAKNRFDLESNAMLGLDFTQFFSEKFFVSATLHHSISESFTYGPGIKASGDKQITVPRIKFSYLVTENMGITAGYSSLRYKIDALHMDTTLGGYTLGVMYKF